MRPRVAKQTTRKLGDQRVRHGPDYYFCPRILKIREPIMRKLCLFIAIALNLALGTAWAAAAGPSPDTAKTVPSAAAAPAVPAPSVAAAPVDSAQPVDSAAATPLATTPAEPVDSASMAPVAVLPPPNPTSRALFPDYGLVGRQYAFGIVGQAVAGALGFFIGSAIETAIEGEEEAHKGTLSFTGIRYDNFYGAFWGASTGGLFGSSLATYFTGQSDEDDGGFFWTMVGTGIAGAGACYAATLMGVNDDVDWTPFIPLLAIPTAGGVVGFHVSRWFSDRKRERIMGPDAGLTLHPPRLAWSPAPGGDRFHFQALNLSF